MGHRKVCTLCICNYQLYQEKYINIMFELKDLRMNLNFVIIYWWLFRFIRILKFTTFILSYFLRNLDIFKICLNLDEFKIFQILLFQIFQFKHNLQEYFRYSSIYHYLYGDSINFGPLYIFDLRLSQNNLTGIMPK